MAIKQRKSNVKKAIQKAAVAELARRVISRRRLLQFTLYTFGKEYLVNWHHELLCQKLEDWAHGYIKRLMLFLPPRHGKTELASRRLPAYILGLNPNASIIATSYSDDLASDNNRAVQRIIDSNQFQNLFPNTYLSGHGNKSVALRNSSVFEIIGQDGSYRSTGIGGGITGKGYEYGIIDDPIKNRAEAESEAYRNRIWDWYTSTFYTRQNSDNARILIILTRWHEDDLAGRLKKHQIEGGKFADQWEIVCLPAIMENNMIPAKGDNRLIGKALWPERYPLSFLNTVKANNFYDWESLYQQRPYPPGGSKIKREWFNVVDIVPGGLRWSRFWDLAVSTKTSADYTASIAGAIDKNGDFYLRDMVRGRWEWPDTHKILISTAKNEKKVSVGIEEAGQQKGFIDQLLRDEALHGTSIEGYKPDKDKLSRALPWISRAKAGKVHLIRGSWVNEFLAECELFTGHGDKHDDQIDAVSGLYQMVATLGPEAAGGSLEPNSILKQERKSLSDIFPRRNRRVVAF